MGMCGRYRLDVEAAWSMTPGEFEDYLSGAVDGTRDASFMTALVVSIIAKTMGGTNVSAEEILGERRDTEDLTPHDHRAMFLADARRRTERRRAKERKAYLPDGIVLDDE